MATRLTVAWLMALAIFTILAVAECALAAAGTAANSNTNAKDLHERVVRGLKGKWVSTWEYPVIQSQQQKQNHQQQQEKKAIADNNANDVNANFQQQLTANGFAIARINGTLSWTNSSAAAAADAATANVFGEKPSDDTLVWSITRPDRSMTDKIVVFETAAAAAASAAKEKEEEGELTPDFYFPILEKKVLPFYESFDGTYHTTTTTADDDIATANKATATVSDIPSYGYVLCYEESATVPTKPHRTADGELFTATRRVVASTSDNAVDKKSLYISRSSVFNGVIFPIETPKDATMTAADAQKHFCGGATSTATTEKTTPLTITTVGAATNTLTNGILYRLFDTTAASTTTTSSASTVMGTWDYDSIVFEFGLLPHERARAAAAPAAAVGSLTDKRTKMGGASADAASADSATAPDATEAEAAREAEKKAAIATVLAEKAAALRASLLSASAALAEHPLVAQVLAATASGDDAEEKQMNNNVLHHRITLRRLFRAEDIPLLVRLSGMVDAYWRTALIAFGFIFFRFYVGYRYGSKKMQTGRKELAAEEEALRKATLAKRK